MAQLRCLELAVLAAAQLFAAATVARAQSPASSSASSDPPLTTGAAVGIAVAVSVVVCFAIGAVIICLTVRHYGRLPRRRPTGQNPGGSSGHHGNSHSDQQHQSVIFVEEGSGRTGNESAAADTRQNPKHLADNPRDVHTIAVKVTSPDDLRFKICRRDGQIFVATDPAHSSLCSREGVRSGDRILGVHVDIEGATAAHPMEVSELLSLSSDYALTVAFQHRGPVLRGPPVAPGAARHQRPASAAEKALRKQRAQPVVEAADAVGDPSPPAVRRYSAAAQKRSRKSHAPEPPSPDEPQDSASSTFPIRDRRTRWDGEADVTDGADRLEVLSEALAQAPLDEREWQPLAVRLVTRENVDSESDESESSGSEAGTSDVQIAEQQEDEAVEEEIEDSIQQTSAARVAASATRAERPPPSPRAPRVERIFDHYELEEQDVVPAMPPPSAERPVVDFSSQFNVAEETQTEASVVALLATPVWESLPNHPEKPAGCAWVSLPNHPQVVAPLASLLTDEPDGDPEVPPLPEFLVPFDDEESTAQTDTVWGGGREVAFALEANFDLGFGDPFFSDKSAESATADVGIVGASIGAEFEDVIDWSRPDQGDQQVDIPTAGVSFSSGPIPAESYTEEQTLGSLVMPEEFSDGAADPVDAHRQEEPEDEDNELASYLLTAGQRAQQQRAAAPDDSTASSSVQTVQEDAVVEMIMTNEHSGNRGPKPRREDPQLAELARSMALRDVEVATVLLLDSEARRRRQLELLEASYDDDNAEAATGSSSGRSTIHEDAIDPTTAPERRADWAEAAEADANDAEAAAALNADFDLAAIEWAARATPPPTPPSSPPAPELRGDADSPLLDAGLVGEIVQGAEGIWDDDAAANFELDESQLSGEQLSQLLDQLEDKGEDDFY